MSKKISETEQQRHREKMAELKGHVGKKVRAAKEDKGLVIVLTGDGKGKSSSGFGMALRSLGHGLKVGVVQFIKGDWKTGEQQFFQDHPEVSYYCMGSGFTWDTQDKQGDIERVENCWREACRMIAEENLDFLLLDEINVVVSYGYLAVDTVVEELSKKPDSLHVVLTGRNADKKFIEIADTVSEVTSPKHAFENGIRAQRGIEF
ncbi:cob(I)yrinic acid a,c-diamide adenosyltransferase [bacterium J17]|nr:cob(I)yrinic acid a,c-diamide adenosyltransferase [bacterium J17]